MSENILIAFDLKKELYETFTLKVASLIHEILAANEINVHSVTKRTKDRKSLARKLSKTGATYSALEDVTDIAAVRITTYFEDDVDRVVEILAKEFRPDAANSVDKRTLLDPDRFGYMSTHHVVQLSTGRCALLEYRRFEHLKVEIQTRSILQHAWAEIEHDLGYKSILEVPKDIRRRFSRLSGLLELADSEFIAIRDQLQIYNANVEEEISVRAETADINKDTLVAFVESSALVQRLDRLAAELTDWEISQDNTNIASLVELLDFFKISTVGELDRILTLHAGSVEEFMRIWINRHPPTTKSAVVGYGVSIFYLGFFMSAKDQDVEKIRSFLKRMNFDFALVEKIQAIYMALTLR